MSVNCYFIPNPIFLQDKTGQTFREKYLKTTSNSEEPIIGFPNKNTSTKVERG